MTGPENSADVPGDGPTALVRAAASSPDDQLKADIRHRLFGPPGASRRIGRFKLLERLGEGGMGVVYSALDDELGRKIAIKLLHGDQVVGSEGRARLLREAQALARLSHPNVVQVYEVGTHEGHVFVAMEYVRGETLKQWLRGDRARADILRVMIHAGRGLAAAHAAKLVHRDFKPDNVIVPRDGQVRVLDFGLARRPTDSADGTAEANPLDETAEVAGLLDDPVTHTGALMGTPAYMAPEQYTGASTGPRTDQFSFAVTLYEALYGVRPHAGRTLKELGMAILQGKVIETPPGKGVPGWLHSAVMRGLATEPSDRYDSMEQFISALGRPRSRGRLGIVATATALGGALVAFGLGSQVDRAPTVEPLPSCEPIDNVLADVWSSGRQGVVERNFVARAGERAAVVFEVTSERMNRRVEAWTPRYEAACSAVPATAEERKLEASRRRCLRGYVRQLGAFSDRFASPDTSASMLGAAGRAIAWLPLPTRCDDAASLEALGSTPAPPPEIESALAALETDTRFGAALVSASRFAEARALADAALVGARELGSAKVEAHALLLLASVTTERGNSRRYTEEALTAARRSGDPWAVAMTAIRVAVERAWADPDDADAAFDAAEAAMSRVAKDPLLQAWFNTALAFRHEDRSEEFLRESISAYEQVDPAGPLGGGSRNNLSVQLRQKGLEEESLALLREAVDIESRDLGESSSLRVFLLLNISSALTRQGKHEEALVFAKDAVDRKAASGIRSGGRARAHLTYAWALRRLDRIDASIIQLHEAAEIAQVGDDVPGLAMALADVARLESERGHLEAATAAVDDALRSLQQQYAGAQLARNGSYRSVLVLRAELHLLQGEHSRAIDLADRVLAMDPSSPDFPIQNFAFGRSGIPDEPWARYVVARALTEAHRDAPRARELARLARASLPDPATLDDPVGRRLVTTWRAWLDAH